MRFARGSLHSSSMPTTADFRQLFCRLDDMSFRVEGVFLLGDEFYDVSAISADEAIKELHIEIDVQRGPRVAMERAESLPLSAASAGEFDAIVCEHSLETCCPLDRLEINRTSVRRLRF